MKTFEDLWKHVNVARWRQEPSIFMLQSNAKSFLVTFRLKCRHTKNCVDSVDRGEINNTINKYR